MYKYRQPRKTSIGVNASYPAERLEDKVKRILNNKEPIKDGAPMIYTERKDGVKAELDIRTDKWEIAAEAMDKVSRGRLAKSMENPKAKTGATEGTVTLEGEAKGQSADGTGTTNTTSVAG